MSIFWPFSKLKFFPLKIFLFFLQYQKRRFLIHVLPFQKMSIFWPLLKLQFFGLIMIVFYLKYPKTIFSDIISVKNSDKRKFDFWTKSMDYPFKKCPFFGHCLNFVFWSFNDCFRFKISKKDLF